MRLRLVRVLALVAIVSMLAAPVTAQPLAASPAAVAPAAAQIVSAQAAQAHAAAPSNNLDKLHPDLRELARTAVPPGAGGQFASAASEVPVYVEVITAIKADGSDAPDLSAYFIDGKYFARPAFGKGEVVQQAVFGQVFPYMLRKLVTLGTVSFVLPVVLEQNGQPDPYPADDTAKPALTAEELAARQAAARTLAANAPAWDQARAINDGYSGPNQPADWFEVDADGPHKAATAWGRGFTGEGVTVAVNDDGIDTAHPDLMGTQRIYSSTLRTVYNGWPMVYSPFSAFLYLNDEAFGTHYLANGFPGLHYVDTSAIADLTACGAGVSCFDFTPLFDYAEEGIEHTYTISDSMSASGDVHVGTHPDFDLIYIWGERPAIIVTDPITPGVYSTVYVDLDDDYDFRDEKPLTRADINDLGATYNNMVAYRDLNADGLADVSGGMLYFIANGTSCIPGMDYIWGCGGYGPLMIPSNGDLVAFSGGSFDREYSHGTQIASNIAGQGVVNGMLPEFSDAAPTAAIYGMAPDAKLVNVSDIYYNFESSLIDAYIFAAVGYDRCDQTGYNWYSGSGCSDTDPIQVTNNSYGNSDQDNDGWDYLGQLVSQIQYWDAPYLQFMFSTGNGAPGYGTAAPPSPAFGIAVGASTEFGSTGWDSITSTTQIMYNDIIPFSNRGPGARGTSGVDVVAGGAYAAGAEELNYYSILTWGTPDGNRSWDSWGGTSRSSPVAAGVLALIDGAYYADNGDWPDYLTARALLMSSATDLNYDTFTQGSGSVNADRGTAIAGGLYGLYVKDSPSWEPGDYRGDDYPAFAHVAYPSGTYTREFTLENTGSEPITAGIADTELLLQSRQTVTMTITPEMVAAESVYGEEDSDNFYKAFNFFIPITATDSVISNNADWANVVVPDDADLMIVRMTFPFDEFDTNGDYAGSGDNRFYLNAYNWDDVNGDYDVWDDSNGNGVVNFINSHVITQIDGGDELVWDDPLTELDQWEFGRFGYHRPGSNTLEMWVHNPYDRMIDGLFLGLRHHPAGRADITTHISFQFEFYREEDVTWLSTNTSSLPVAGNDSASFVATVDVPSDMPAGMYQAAIEVSYADWTTYPGGTEIIPVALTVVNDFSDGMTLGGYDSYNYDADRPYNNGAVRGLFDWSWRPESGDWRFFMTDVNNGPTVAGDPYPEGTQFIVRSDWASPAPSTDIDTIVLGPTESSLGGPDWYAFEDPDFFGPYTLDTIGKSVNTNVTAGTWLFDTATGGPTEFVAAPLQDGLHAFLAHNVLFDGTAHDAVFTYTIGTASVQPTSLITTTGFNSGTVGTLTFESSLNLTGLEVEGFGLSQPEEFDDEALPDGAGYDFEYEFVVEHGASIQVETSSGDVSDLDLDLYYCGPATGQVGTGTCSLITSSAGGTAVEFVEVIDPEDGIYLVAIENFSGPAGTFDMTIRTIQGTGLMVSGVPAGAVTANTPVVLTVTFDQELEIGKTYEGLILLGPTEAPTIMQIVVEVTRAGARIYFPMLNN